MNASVRARAAEDKVLFVDLTFVPLVEKLQASLPHVKAFVIMTDRKHMPGAWGVLRLPPRRFVVLAALPVVSRRRTEPGCAPFRTASTATSRPAGSPCV